MILNELAAVTFECGKVWIVSVQRRSSCLHDTARARRIDWEGGERAGTGVDVEVEQGVERCRSVLLEVGEGSIPKKELNGGWYGRQGCLRNDEWPLLSLIAPLVAGCNRHFSAGYWPVVNIADGGNLRRG